MLVFKWDRYFPSLEVYNLMQYLVGVPLHHACHVLSCVFSNLRKLSISYHITHTEIALFFHELYHSGSVLHLFWKTSFLKQLFRENLFQKNLSRTNLFRENLSRNNLFLEKTCFGKKPVSNKPITYSY